MDFLYHQWASEIERLELADRQVTAAFIAAGSKDTKLVRPGDYRRTWDEWLVSPLEVKATDRDRDRLHSILLGVA